MIWPGRETGCGKRYAASTRPETSIAPTSNIASGPATDSRAPLNLLLAADGSHAGFIAMRATREHGRVVGDEADPSAEKLQRGTVPTTTPRPHYRHVKFPASLVLPTPE